MCINYIHVHINTDNQHTHLYVHLHLQPVFMYVIKLCNPSDVHNNYAAMFDSSTPLF